ncbi:MAG: DEAD/DEAH box helicase, partial [Candidatus Hermodarchaeota archaeon]
MLIISISRYKHKKEEINDDRENKREIFKYLNDERILRVLFELKIFKLRDIQKEAIKKGLFFQKSFLVCAPSGSGKTLIGELCIINNIFQNFDKSVYLAPFKALAMEKYYHFKKCYEKFGVKIVLSIGDYELNDYHLENAHIIITTYEKMDSILRNFFDREWIFEISTVVIDEIHIIGENDRGPRLESLIVRLNEFLHNPQIIGLSATIANPEFLNSWLSSLGNKTNLILSNSRPVPLHFRVEMAQNKNLRIEKLIKGILNKDGQVMVFLNKRKSTQQLALSLSKLVEKSLKDSELRNCKYIEERLKKIKGNNSELRNVMKKGVAFHHAGLLPKEKKIIEDYSRKKIIKVICCTTTLSAGVNIPTRVVIIKDFKKYIISGYKIKNFIGYHENGDGFSFFKPFSANEIFQMLGRAGRPGLDKIGYGVILVNNIEEKMWVEDNFFQRNPKEKKYQPRYNNLISGLNNVNTLKEQVLLRIYEGKNITIQKLKNFFEKTFFWYIIKEKMKEQKIPITQLLLINEINTNNILKLHSDSKKVRLLKNS